MRILIHSPQSSGGIAEHTRYQFLAFQRAGADVALLCPPDFLKGRSLQGNVARVYCSLSKRPSGLRGWRNAVRVAANGVRYLINQWRLAWEVLRRKPDMVLLDSYMEYLSPLWVWPHIVIARIRSVTYVANLHDPVRNFIVGPLWWHEWSVALAYRPLNIGIIHEKISKDSSLPTHVDIHEAPVGVYDLQSIPVDSMEVRRNWGAPDDAIVFLSFGFIRDNKNLDLLIRALQFNKQVFLVVVGSAQSSKNKPLQFYQELASAMHVDNRVVFRDEFVPDEALASYFTAADFIAMTYNRDFHSQSGVLNIAARARRRVLASSGESPLGSSVKRFRLGEFVEPDNLELLAAGMRKLCRQHLGELSAPEPNWQGYEEYASWDSNAKIILSAAQAARYKR